MDDIFSYINPLTIISKMLGLSHFVWTNKSLSKLWVLYSVLLMCLMISLSTYEFLRQMNDQVSSKLFKFVSFTRFVFPTIFRTSICATFIWKYKVIIHFLNSISNVETVIQKTLMIKLPRKLYVKVQIMLSSIIIAAVCIQAYLAFTISGLIPSVLTFFSLVSYIGQAQFVCCVILLNQYLNIVKTKISELCEGNYSDDYIKLMDRSNSQMQRFGKVRKNNNVFTNNDVECVINICKELLRYISIIQGDLNSFFSFPILLMLGDVMLVTTFNLYMIIKYLSLSMTLFELSQQINYIYLVFLSVVQAACFAFPCAVANYEVQSTALLTHELLNKVKQINYDAVDLKSLSKELLHIEIIFTACGFFVLNESLLTSVFAAISTQLVILLQFQMSPSDQNNNQ